MKRLTPVERSAIMLARSVHLGERAVAEVVARRARLRGLAPRDIAALLDGGVPDDRDLALLVATAWLMLDTGGRLANDDVDDLCDAGVEPLIAAQVAALVGVEPTGPGV